MSVRETDSTKREKIETRCKGVQQIGTHYNREVSAKGTGRDRFYQETWKMDDGG